MMKRNIVLGTLFLFLSVVVSAENQLIIITSFPKDLFETYKRAFEAKHPQIDVVVRSKKTSAAVAYIRETSKRPNSDLVWASAADAFAVLKEEGLLETYELPDEVGELIPEKIGTYPIHDPDRQYFGGALSGYGIMWNKDYLEAYHLDPPKEWPDLTASAYHGHLAMSAPSRSGTTHLTVEAILQGYGWEKGWEILFSMCGNMSVITERSFGVPQGVINGEFGIGVVIDFFGLSAEASGLPVEFVYPSITPIVPASIGLINGAPNKENAQEFINFFLGQEGQRLLFDSKISRLPVIPELYRDAPLGFPNPFEMKKTATKFDVQLSQQRYGLINSLFDQLITFRLRGLKSAWSEIHKAEKRIEKKESRNQDVAVLRKLIAEAKALVTRVPILEVEANDFEYNQHFAKEADKVQIQAETAWDAIAKKNYRLAKESAKKVK
jgi:ABC-type Fe3+ transport system substrate-binding protein